MSYAQTPYLNAMFKYRMSKGQLFKILVCGQHGIYGFKIAGSKVGSRGSHFPEKLFVYLFVLATRLLGMLLTVTVQRSTSFSAMYKNSVPLKRNRKRLR
jgi:hypothetical protein